MLLAGVFALGFTASTAGAQVAVDGTVDAAYGARTATVLFNPAAPTSNFQAPTNQNHLTAYDIFLTSLDGRYYGAIQADGANSGFPVFSNLYFDLFPANNDGSDLGFELSPQSANAFIPGRDGRAAVTDFQSAVSADGLTFEFSLSNAAFTTKFAGLNYYDDFLASDGSSVVLRLSQSFGFSAAGGATYGPNRLGAVTLDAAVAAVPEPAAWAMMIVGVGAVGGAMRRRRTATRVAFA